MTNARYRQNAGSVFALKYHFVWCPKYRRKVLVGEVADDRRKLLDEKADQIDAQIEGVEIMSDHVHLFVSADPTAAPQ